MGAEAQLGVIESIELVNFMCHRYLKVNLGPKINFIIGHNGSGKSAILSGITVCLGGKATVTNRASNLKSLIREGSSVGQVVVKLRNQGSEAYKPEVYEDCIIIERRISRDGNNGYKIKSSEGKTISTKREELSAICDHMGIQIDNPMNVLSQDTARQFLNSTSPEEKYKFFLRGTQLTQLSEDNEIIRESIDTTENIIRNKKQVLPDLLKEAKNAEGRFKDMEQARELRLKVEAMKREIAWAQVVEKEESLHVAETRLYKGQKKLPAIQNELEKENTNFEQINTRISQLENEKNEHQMALRPLEKRKQQPIEALKEKRRQLQDFQHETQEINGTFKSLRSNLAELEKKIKDETSKLNGDNSNRREEALNKIKALELEIEDAKRGIEESREKHKEYEVSNTEAKERYSQIRESIKSIEREVSEFKENIRRLEDQKTNRLKAFGSMMPEILKEVERESRWKSKPVGPIGAYTKLRKSEWADTMESLVGNLLDCFIVEYHQDRQLLQSILHKYKCPSKIFVSKNDNFDYSAGEPDQRFLTALRVLEFSHEFVKRQMIVHANIEQTILVEKRTEANQIMGSGFPRNVNSCFTIDGFKVGHRGGGYATQAMNQYRGPPRFTQDLDKKIRQYQYSVEEKIETLGTQNDRLKEVDFEIREADRKKQMLNNKIGNFQKDITFKSRTIRQLHDQLQEEEPANIVALEEARQDTERQIELIKNQFEQLQLQKTQIAEEEKLLREELDNIKREIESALDKMEQIKTKIEDQINERIQCETNKQYWTNKLEDEQGKILELQNEVTRRQEIVDETTAQAQEYCPERVEVTKTATQLDREINQIQLRLKESEKGFGGTIEEVLRDMKNKVDSYRKAKTEIANMEHFVRDLKYALGLRLKRWDDFRSYIAKRARINFHWNLAQRGYSGKLEFDHKNRKLNPRVQVDDQAENLTRDKDPKSLSGGEKSFSTICLLLSLWEAMGCPIRCLDEFDVFMDAVNRKISMRMMIESARQADETQYILITPQDMSNVSPGPDIRVHRLNDPERNQPPLHS